jgi:hypothetical protein
MFEIVMSAVLKRGEDLKIFKPVVSFVAVSVMDDLRR